MKTVSTMIGLALLAGQALGAVVTLVDQHVDLSVNFSGSLVGSGTNPWRLTVRDEEARREFAGERAGFPDPERVLLEVVEAARVEVPDDPRYTDFLGPAGTSLWILPQGQETGVLYAGFSTENKASQTGWSGFGVTSPLLTRGVATGAFKNNQVTVSLVGFSGPGNFHLYSTDAFGNPTISFDTSNGLDFSDARIFTPGNHAHFNWAFSEPGEYALMLQASGTLEVGNELSESDVTTFRFVVIPEPGAAWMVLTGTSALFCLRVRRRR